LVLVDQNYHKKEIKKIIGKSLIEFLSTESGRMLIKCGIPNDSDSTTK
jgi:hypothetical protein